MPSDRPARAEDPSATPPDPARARRAARGLLLTACAAGLVGLAVPGTPAPERVSLTAATAASPTVVVPEPAVRHGVVPAVPKRVAPRADRTRRVAARRKPVAPRRKLVRWVRPSSAAVVSPFGTRWGRPHKGIDFGAHYGAPIRAIGDGVVIGAGYLPEESGYGQITLIRHSNGVVSAYAHQSRMLVHAGERVTAGEVIGYVGSTGHVTGPHLHFEIRMSTHGGQVDPRAWLRQHGVYV